jgi:hypothetical protein
MSTAKLFPFLAAKLPEANAPMMSAKPTIGLMPKRCELRYEVLVDSGSDICMVHADIGRALDIDIENGESFELGGVTGENRTAPYSNHKSR